MTWSSSQTSVGVSPTCVCRSCWLTEESVCGRRASALAGSSILKVSTLPFGVRRGLGALCAYVRKSVA
jgi:hypothetical protein